MITPTDILNASILIVDDQEANVILLESVLAEAGYTHVTSTLAPAEVRALHRQEHFDLILLDLQMPGMDGFEVMRGLREDLQLQDVTGDYVPVIVFTAQPGHKQRALEAGAKDFISKPFDLLEVKTRIRNMLEVRLLHKQLALYNQRLEQIVTERTAELRDSEARYKSLAELASDWYWEQDALGNFTRVSGSVLDMLGLRVDNLSGENTAGLPASGWNEAERAALRSKIEARQPFLDFMFSRVNADGGKQQFRVSGEPIFGPGGHFVGYRGIGVEMVLAHPQG